MVTKTSSRTETDERQLRILAAILETVAASPLGAPSGVMYAALMGTAGAEGVSLGIYNELIALAVEMKLVTLSRSHLVKITNDGRRMVENINATRAKIAAEKERSP